MWTVGLRAACLAVVAILPAACSRFGIDAIVPDTDADGATPGSDDDAGGAEDAGENCTSFKANFGVDDLGANGFTSPEGDIEVAGGALVASVSTTGSNPFASHASHEFEIPPGAKLDFASVEFTLTLSALPPEGAMTFGCMLYARHSRERAQESNQAFIQFDDEVKVTLAAKTTNTPKGESSQMLFTRETMPVKTAIKARLELKVTNDGTAATAELGGKSASTESVPLVAPDPRLVTIECGIPSAQTADGTIVADVKIDDLSAKVCVER